MDVSTSDASFSQFCAGRQSLPNFLPNAPRLLLRALDKWLENSPDASKEEKVAVIQGLKQTLKEGCTNKNWKLESIPFLIQREDPVATGAIVILEPPCFSALLM